MKVEIWSDIACPFCYIGKKHFETALNALEFKDNITVEWKSFQLDPSIPESGLNMTSAEYLEKHKGYPKTQLDSMFEHLKNQGKTVGIDFRNDLAIPANTFRAHRLIHLAKSVGKANEMEEALFYAHFTAGEDVNDIPTLTKLATDLGLDAKEVEEVLTTEQLAEAVKKDIIEASQLKIQGVPFFVIDRKYGISGAQPVSVFKQSLTQAYQEHSPQFEMKGNTENNACGPDNCEI